MQDNYFDRLIRTKLQSYEVAEGPSDWEALAERLDADFDAAMASRLAAASVAYDPADWDAMNEMLGHPFDMAVRAKLGGLSFAAFDADWATLGDRLDADFDTGIRQPLAAMEIPPQAEDWAEMNRLLNAEMPLPWFQKVAPLMDVVLLLLLAFLWWGDTQLPGPTSMANDIRQESVPTETKKQADKPQEEVDNSKAEGIAHEAKASLSEGATTPRIQHLPTHLVSPENNQEKPQLAQTEPLVDNVQAKRTVFQISKGRPLQHKIMPPLASGPQGLDKEASSNGLRAIRLGLTASRIFSAAEFNDTGLSGYLAGLRVELPISDKLSLISGIQYGEKHFDRMQLNVAIDNSSLNRQPTYWISRLHGDIQLLEIPILLRYRFSTENKVNFYFQGGFTPVITLDEKYLHYDPRSAGNLGQTQAQTGIDFTTAENNPDLVTYLNSLQPNVDVHRLNTYVGFLQITPGIEVKLSSHLSLQTEPYIQLGLQRIGSERQSLHSIGGTFSLMYLLPNKK